jgi:hypothetical protein
VSHFETRLASRIAGQIADIISMLLRLLTAILLSIFTFAAHAKTLARKPVRIDPGTRVMVMVKAEAQVGQWIGAFPKDAQIVRQAHPLYVVQLSKPVTPALLEKIRRNSFVVRAVQDTEVRASKTRQLGDQCVQTAQSSNLQDILNLIDQSGTDCDLAPSCSSDGTAALQAQMAVAGDLMLAEMSRLGIKDGHTKVAVVDTGFNPELLQFMTRPPKWYGGGGDTNPGMNEGNYAHGSPVAGLIGGKNGVGLAPGADIGIFQYPTDDKGAGHASDANIAILNACNSGHKIINVSTEKLNTDRDIPELVSLLAKKGCLVVNSAGNEPGIGLKNTSKEDAWLRVGGKNVETGENAPLELGEVDAPGFGVATFDAKAEGQCLEQPLSPKTGTSFSAPIVSAILANVRGILVGDPAFEKLNGPDQIKLLNSIIGQSTRGGMVNGLRAVMIAEAWTKASGRKPIGPKAVGNLLLNPKPAVCSQPPKSTDLESLGCTDRKASLDSARARAALCTPVNEKELSEIIQSVAKLDEAGIAKNLTHYLKNGEAMRDSISLGQKAKEAADPAAVEAAETDRAIREVTQRINLESRMKSEAIEQGALDVWIKLMSAEQTMLLAAKMETERSLRDLKRNPEPHAAQIATLKAREAAIDDRLACYAVWRDTFNGVKGEDITASQFHDLNWQARQKGGCEDPAAFFPQPFQALAIHSAQGGMFESYWARHQAELSKLREKFVELNGVGP